MNKRSYLGVGDLLQEVVKNDVLVVLAKKSPGTLEVLPLVHQPVVGSQEGDVQLGDDEVLVVPGVAGQGLAVELGVSAQSPSREVVVIVLARRTTSALGHLPDPHLLAVPRCYPAVDTVKLQRRRAGVAYLPPDLGAPQRGKVGVDEIG